MPAPADTPYVKGSTFALWRIVTWLLLLLAVFGIFQYSVHAWHVGGLLDMEGWEDRRASLLGMLAWDVAYLIVACAAVASAAGALLRRGWARSALRVVAAVLALWLLATTIMMLARWSTFNHQSAALAGESGLSDVARDMVERVRRQYLVAMVLKAVAVPVLAWLSWRLGRPAVRAQFMPRRRR